MSRPEKPKKEPNSLPGNRKKLAQNELEANRFKWFGDTLPNGYTVITEGHFIYYSKAEELDELAAFIGEFNLLGNVTIKKLPKTHLSDVDAVIRDVKPITSLAQFNPMKSTKQRDWIGVDISEVSNDERAFGGCSEKCFKLMKKFFKADKSQINVGVTKLNQDYLLVLATQDKSEIGALILNPMKSFESRFRKSREYEQKCIPMKTRYAHNESKKERREG